MGRWVTKQTYNKITNKAKYKHHGFVLLPIVFTNMK